MRIRIKSFHIRHNKIGQKNTNKTEFRWPRRGVEIANYRTAPEHVGYLPEQYHGRRFACVYPGQTQAQTLCQLSENIPRIVDTGTIQVLINIFFELFVPRVPYTVPEIFTLFSIFGRMPGFEPELLRPQPGVLPMRYAHPYQ